MTLGEWWCDLNCWRWPIDIALPDDWYELTKGEQELAIKAAYEVVVALGGQSEGMVLWRQRLDAHKPCWDPRSREIGAPASRAPREAQG